MEITLEHLHNITNNKKKIALFIRKSFVISFFLCFFSSDFLVHLIRRRFCWAANTLLCYICNCVTPFRYDFRTWYFWPFVFYDGVFFLAHFFYFEVCYTEWDEGVGSIKKPNWIEYSVNAFVLHETLWSCACPISKMPIDFRIYGSIHKSWDFRGHNIMDFSACRSNNRQNNIHLVNMLLWPQWYWIKKRSAFRSMHLGVSVLCNQVGDVLCCAVLWCDLMCAYAVMCFYLSPSLPLFLSLCVCVCVFRSLLCMCVGYALVQLICIFSDELSW